MEKWWREQMNKVVELEAFPDSIRILRSSKKKRIFVQYGKGFLCFVGEKRKFKY